MFADNQVIVSPPGIPIATSPQQGPPSSASSSLPPSSSAPLSSVASSSAPLYNVPVTSVPASSLLLSPLTVSQQAQSESPLPVHVPPLNLNGLLKTPLTSGGGGEREQSVTPTSDEKDSETVSSSVATPPPDIPSCYLVKSDEPGGDEVSTLLLSTVSSLPVTPAPSRLQNLLTTTGLSSFPTPSLLSNEIDNLYELTQVLPRTDDEQKSLVNVVPSSGATTHTSSNNTLPVSDSTVLFSETKLEEDGAQECTVKSVAKVSFASPLKRSLSSVSPNETPPDSPPLSSPKITPLVLSDRNSSSSREATPSPTEEARASKVAEIRSMLDSTRLNINTLLYSLKNTSEAPPTDHTHDPTLTDENDNRASSPDPAIIKQSLPVPAINDNNNRISSPAITESDPVTEKISIFSSPDPVLTKQLQTPPTIIALNSESHDSHMISDQLSRFSLINDKDGGDKEKEAIFDIGTSLKALLSEHFPQASHSSPPNLTNIQSSSSFSITPSPPSSPSSVQPVSIPIAQSIKEARESDTATDNDTLTQSPVPMDTPKKSPVQLPPPPSLTSPVPTCTCTSTSTHTLVSSHYSLPNVSSIAAAPMATVSVISSPIGVSPSVPVTVSTSHLSPSSLLTASLPISSTLPTTVSPSPSLLSLSSLPPSFSSIQHSSLSFSTVPPLTLPSSVVVTSSSPLSLAPIAPPLSSAVLQSNNDTVNHLLSKPVKPVPSLSSSPSDSESRYHLSLSPSNTSLSLSGRSTPDPAFSFQATPTSSHVPSTLKPDPVPVLPPAEAIEVPGVVSFGDLCCVGGVGVANINVKNISSDRWIQGHIQHHLLYHNDSTVSVLYNLCVL